MVELSPPTVATTSTVPEPAGAAAVQEVVELQVTSVAALGPKAKTVGPGALENPVPVTVTASPPEG